MQHYNNIAFAAAVDSSDVVTGGVTFLAGATITVRDSGGSIATIYSDNGSTLKSNPFTASDDGEYDFYAANGTYSIQAAATGYATDTRSGIVLFDPLDAGIVSVKNFGAAGDGVTDDAQAFSDAIASMTDGGVLRIPVGVYVTNSFFELVCDNIIIEGNGDGTILKSLDTSTDKKQTLLVTGNNNKIRRLKVDGNKSAIAQASGFKRGGIATYGNYNTVEQCTVVDTFADGIRVQFGTDYLVRGVGGTVRQCTVNGAGQHAAANNSFGIIVAYLEDVLVTECIIDDTLTSGIFTYNCIHQAISNNRVTNTENGIRTQPYNTTPTGGDSYATITGNVIHEPAGDGIRFTGNVISVTGNIVSGATSNGSGAYSQGGRYQTISGNTFINNQNYGIAISGNSGSPTDQLTIVGNTCYGNFYGIYLQPAAVGPITNAFVANNNLVGNTSSGINIGGSGGANTLRLGNNTGTYGATYTYWTIENTTAIGNSITAASTITVGGHDVYGVSGAADITQINGGTQGQIITLHFVSTKATNGVVNGGNLKLKGDFPYSPGSSLTLLYYASYWNEVSRSSTELQTIASASTIEITADADVVGITGTSDITQINGGYERQQVTLFFVSNCASNGVVDGGNIRLKGNFLYTIKSNLTLISIGGEWCEVSRSSNGTYNVVAASTVTISADASVIGVTGTDDITTLAGGFDRQQITFVFIDSAATNGVVDGSNLRLAGNFAYTANDTLVLVRSGSNWYEVCRSVN